MKTFGYVMASVPVMLLAACTTVPSGPSMLVLPGTGKSFEQFRADDSACKQYASAQVNGATPSSVAADSGVRSAAVGALLGAAAGAAINGSSGAGVGAGAGLAMGGLVGTGAADASAHGLQQRYDFSYQQCMYASGHRIPVAGRFTPGMYVPPSATQQGYVPPPPPGSPPPPPPTYLR